MKTYTVLIAILGMHFITNGSHHKITGNTTTLNITVASPETKQEICPTVYHQPENGFDYEGYLEGHQWNTRSQNLSSEQQEKWLNFLTKNINTTGNEVTREMLAPIIIQGLDYVEKKDILTFAILDDSPAAIKRAVKEGFDINQPWEKKGNMLIMAITLNKYNAVKTLIELGSNVNQFIQETIRGTHAMEIKHVSPLSKALELKHLKIAELLIRHGAREN